MSRTSPTQVFLSNGNPFVYGDIKLAEIGKTSSTLSTIAEVYRVDITESGVLGVVLDSRKSVSSGSNPKISAEGQGRTTFGAYGISYTLAKDSNGNKILDSSDLFIDRKVIDATGGFKSAVVFQKNVTPGTYFVELDDANGSSRSLTQSEILFDPSDNYGESLGNISDPKGGGGNGNVTRTTLKGNPSAYMGAIRDYDGNDLGNVSSWKFAGDADVQGDGDSESIFVNTSNERWATVGDTNGVVDFSKHGFGGDTRVVGIYIDPTLKDKPQNRGGPFDSQRRFQNDLRLNNLSVLAAADYNKDGFQDVYFRVNDGTAVLRGLMHKDGNIQYANYQSKDDLTAFMSANGVSSSVYSSWI